jgi:hypothetical protein
MNNNVTVGDNVTDTHYFYHKTPARHYTVAYTHDRATGRVTFGVSCCREAKIIPGEINKIPFEVRQRLDIFSKDEGRRLANERLAQIPETLDVNPETKRTDVHALIRRRFRNYFYGTRQS